MKGALIGAVVGVLVFHGILQFVFWGISVADIAAMGPGERVIALLTHAVAGVFGLHAGSWFDV